MLTARTSAADQTQDLAAALAGLCGAGDLLLLVGDLGAGKTAFTQGFGRAIGVTDLITSPTFTLANEYRGTRPTRGTPEQGSNQRGPGSLSSKELRDGRARPADAPGSQGRLLMHHLDVYRLEQLEDVRDLALPELLDGQAITLIEWGDTILPALPNDFIEVRLLFGDGDDDRIIELRCIGSRWSARSGAVATALDQWLVPC